MTRLRLPGPLDPHVHLRGLDWARKGTMHSETRAAVAGGYTAVLDMPNAEPTTTSLPGLERKRDELRAQAVCDWGVYYGAHPAGNLESFAAAMPRTVGLKLYCNQTTGNLFIDGAARERHFAAWQKHGFIAVHAEDDEVDAVLALVARYRIRTHFCHISTQAETTALRRAKDQGLPVSLGVCPHHLFLTRDDESRLGPLALMKPPLKTAQDQAVLWQGLREGWVDAVESDHAPHALAEKRAMPPAFGVPGLETTLPLMGTAVEEGRLEAARLAELVATAPRRIAGIPCPEDTWTELELGTTDHIQARRMQTLCRWTPFEGQVTRCRVARVRIRGQEAFDGCTILVEPGFGQEVKATRRETP